VEKELIRTLQSLADVRLITISEVSELITCPLIVESILTENRRNLLVTCLYLSSCSSSSVSERFSFECRKVIGFAFTTLRD